jgi:PAS domain S-box-containing protein
MESERNGPSLSPRELQLLRLAASGLTDVAIAERLGISEATVGTYWGRVRIKFGPFSRTELVAVMLRSESEATVNSIKRENALLLEDVQLRLKSGSILSAREILENAPDAFMIIAESGAIEYANGAANELFGYEPGELTGLSHDVLIAPELRAIHAQYSKEYIMDPTRRQMGIHLQTPASKKDGSQLPINAALSTIVSGNGTVVFCTVRA